MDDLLPWSKSSGSAEIDIVKAHEILDEDTTTCKR